MLGRVVALATYGPPELVARPTVKPASLVELSVQTKSIREALATVALRPVGAGNVGGADANTNLMPSAMATALNSATLSMTRILPEIPAAKGNRPSKLQLPALVF